MAEKGAKKKKGKGDANVLGSLSATRPNRLGRHGRDGATTTAAKATSAASRAASKKAARAKPARKPAVAKAAPAKPAAVTTAKPARPKPVRSASEKLAEPAKKSAVKRAPAAPNRSPSGTELVTTVVQAAGELASVGLSIGGQIVKRAVERLPKP